MSKLNWHEVKIHNYLNYEHFQKKEIMMKSILFTLHYSIVFEVTMKTNNSVLLLRRD